MDIDYHRQVAEAKIGLAFLLENEIEYVLQEVARIFPDADYAAKQIKAAYQN